MGIASFGFAVQLWRKIPKWIIQEKKKDQGTFDKGEVSSRELTLSLSKGQKGKNIFHIQFPRSSLEFL